MKGKFFKSAAAVLAVTMAFSGLPVGAYALDTSESVPETSVTAEQFLLNLQHQFIRQIRLSRQIQFIRLSL